MINMLFREKLYLINKEMIKRLYNLFNGKRKCYSDMKVQLSNNESRQVQFFNFWEEPFDEMYWNRWFEARPEILKDNPKMKVGMFSVFGKRDLIHHARCDVNIFYTAENVKSDSCSVYADNFLNEPMIGLSMGYDYFEHERYCRFPNWIDVFFNKQDEVASMCNRLRFPDVSSKTSFASCICSHDRNGLRSQMIDALSNIGTVSCPSKFRHNDDSLMNDYGDDKMEYLKSFYFNICPENSNCMGYVTEKLFQAIYSGCIPIYWGSYNRPEQEVLNQDAIILWKKDGDNSENLKLIRDLVDHPELMKEFLSQPRLLPTADEYILDRLNDVERKIKRIISK